jgi:TRAP-type C4-dicarboxylate transport system permease large subunit
MVVVHRMISGIDSFPLLAVPFFILAGNLMNNAGITNRIYNFALALVGWMKGGLGHVNIIGSVIFAGMSGTAIADAAGLGTIEIKAMRDHGYSKEFSVGVTAASATLGPIIPPSLPFVIYGMVANVSIGQLFLAGILPGLVMTVLMMLTVAYYAHKNNWGADIKFLWSRVGKATLELAIVIAFPLAIWLAVEAGVNAVVATGIAMVALFAADWKWKFEAVLPIMTPVLLIGGMTTGIFTPTEGAVAASIWALFLGLFWYKTLSFKMLVKVSMETIETTATVLFIVAAASIFGWLLTRADSRDPHCCSGADARGPAARHRPRAFRPDRRAQPDDRAPASSDGNGSVRSRTRSPNVARTYDDGDRAVARAVARQPDPDHLHPDHLALVA